MEPSVHAKKKKKKKSIRSAGLCWCLLPSWRIVYFTGQLDGWLLLPLPRFICFLSHLLLDTLKASFRQKIFSLLCISFPSSTASAGQITTHRHDRFSTFSTFFISFRFIISPLLFWFQKKRKKNMFFFKGGKRRARKAFCRFLSSFFFGFKSQREKAKKKKPVRDLCARSAHCLSS